MKKNNAGYVKPNIVIEHEKGTVCIYGELDLEKLIKMLLKSKYIKG